MYSNISWVGLGIGLVRPWMGGGDLVWVDTRLDLVDDFQCHFSLGFQGHV